MLLWASGSKKAGVAVIRCDWKEKLIKACVKRITPRSPCHHRSFSYKLRSTAIATSSRNANKKDSSNGRRLQRMYQWPCERSWKSAFGDHHNARRYQSLSSAFDSCSFKWIRKNANDMACTWCKWDMINNFSSCIMEIT